MGMKITQKKKTKRTHTNTRFSLSILSARCLVFCLASTDSLNYFMNQMIHYCFYFNSSVGLI